LNFTITEVRFSALWWCSSWLWFYCIKKQYLIVLVECGSFYENQKQSAW